MKFCTNCGQELSENSKFCTNCGEKIISVKKIIETPKPIKLKLEKQKYVDINKSELNKINQTIKLQNNQTSIVKKSWIAAGFFAFIVVLAIMDLDSLPIHPAIVMLSIFFCLSAVVIGFMFRSREKKLQSLISGEKLLAAWTLSDFEKQNYVNFLFENEKSKNRGLLMVISVISVVVFGVFILIIDEGKLAMFFVLIGLIVFLSFFAFGLPFYYRNRNLKNDGKILIGKNFAYINGFFHNWDFPLSGIKKAKIIKQPFYGLYIKYYYTDRTLTNTEELNIPASEYIDLRPLVDELNIK
ncbi:zinc ribbon domain-containing protein [uncultured Lutibacter sp.]|uniref:zinc-ribbon domain-containing protein n=1 Tax=uncultured Lutibacter sp. TaxID=437739 RepID=UPI002639AA5A|nr:zinc ribbon domain-containing protein [uncultured Lutibacter sp.]